MPDPQVLVLIPNLTVCMHLIPYATHAKAVVLTVGEAVYIGIVVVQCAVPSGVRTVLCTTPPVTVAANAGVGAIVDAVTDREAGKSTLISGSCVGGSPSSGGFHFTSCH